MMKETDLRKLLTQSETTNLEFKSEFYKIDHANQDVKILNVRK
jgi:hypothetical protein